MKCPFCAQVIPDNDKRCFSCGKSLTTRHYNPATRTEEDVPYYRQTEAQKKRTDLIVKGMIFVVSAAVIGGLCLLFLFRFKPTLFYKTNPEDIGLSATTFDVVQMDEEYYQQHGVTNKVVIPFTLTNRGSRDITTLEAKIYTSSRDLQIWSSRGVVDVFTFVSPASPLRGKESRVVMAEFPVTYQPMGMAAIRWNYDITKIE
jgi:hypothetical protein